MSKYKAPRRYRAFMMTATADLLNIDELEQLAQSVNPKQYAVITHDLDEGSNHYHLALYLDTPMYITALAKKLNTPANFIQKWDGRINNMWSYMVHDTTDAKLHKADYKPYLENPDKFRTNIPNYSELVKAGGDAARKRASARELDELVSKILTGEVNKTQLLKPENIRTYYDNYTKIERALRLRTESLRTNPPTNTTLLLHGKSGTGKTTHAVRTATALYPDNYTVSSSHNDPLQDYQGEKCLILDDFRPMNYDFIDLLALLDPHHRQRSHKSRYYNKPIGTELIIITSTYSLDDIVRYYQQVHPDEDMKQLRRRIGQVTHLDANGKETTTLYNEQYDIYA